MARPASVEMLIGNSRGIKDKRNQERLEIRQLHKEERRRTRKPATEIPPANLAPVNIGEFIVSVHPNGSIKLLPRF